LSSRYVYHSLPTTLIDNPAVWGYLPLNDGESYVHDINLDPFKLHLVGSGEIDVPPELENILVFHKDLNYRDYYDVMAGMDICVPAFGPTDEYYVPQASSTVAMCVEVNVSSFHW
jgi:hypothetical protein